MADQPKAMFEVSEKVIEAFRDIVSECIDQGVDQNETNNHINVVSGLILVATELRLLRESIESCGGNMVQMLDLIQAK